jgi:hypothetical protein
MPMRFLCLVLLCGLAGCHALTRGHEAANSKPEAEPEAVPVTVLARTPGTIAQLRLRASESELAVLGRLEAELALLSGVINEAERVSAPPGQFSYASLRAELAQIRADIRAYRVSEWQQPREIEAARNAPVGGDQP